ncbi:ABC transporter permease [Aerosakkonemataceae cyanobacterium BLCC-F50]|uniref:ABC transporter permease n=1 Tax=Floridaenema flaviceps BLCC-F50 TaxID=3153642 RepID=A0ABV4XSS1_9CYAN
MTRSLTPDIKLLNRNWNWQDGIVILAIISLIFAIIDTASQFTGAYNPNIVIETSLNVLPWYTAQTLLRVAIAYFLSLIFSIIYAYIAYHSTLAAKILLPLLDILQSIPILSFLPGVVLATIAIFPGQQIGIELASILLMFVGMAWNLTFSFYQSLCSIPTELLEAAKTYRLNPLQRFWMLELPAGAIGLVWNSVISVAGGWFFLMAIESFTLGHKSFQLPGLGSYLSKASNQGNFVAIAWGLAVLISIIILLDFLVWRPLIAWAEKFKLELVEAENPPQSIVLDILRQSPTLRMLSDRIWTPLTQTADLTLTRTFNRSSKSIIPNSPSAIASWFNWLFISGFAFIVLWGTWEAALLLRVLNLENWYQVVIAAIFTMLRVTIALVLSLLWTVPVGVAIARNPRISKILQPIVQIAASVPATALFPVLLLYLVRIGGGLEIGSVALMMMGSMWYLLFNVIAGAQAIPSELFEVATVYKLTRIQRWKTLILPGIFPYLITGAITAVGGAWNASIVSEYVQFQGKTLIAPGLGATISQASANNNFSLLLAATVVMSAIVVLTNRLVWRRLYKLAQERYQLL